MIRTLERLISKGDNLTSYHHAELGEIVIKRLARSSGVSVRINASGQVIVTAAKYLPLYFVRRSIDSSLENIRALQRKSPGRPVYRDGMVIGQTRHLQLIPGTSLDAEITADHLTVTTPADIAEEKVQEFISEAVKKLLRKDARTYLEARLHILAKRGDFSYERVRLTHASTRWGSCSTSGTISLNIALMKLPLDLIDYVLIHELCHTREMNHSANFWREVASYAPQYRSQRTRLKRQSPTL